MRHPTREIGCWGAAAVTISAVPVLRTYHHEARVCSGRLASDGGFQSAVAKLNAADQSPSTASQTKAVVHMALATRPIPIATTGKNLAIRVATAPFTNVPMFVHSRSTFCRVEYGIEEVVLRDHLNQIRDKRVFGHAGCVRPLAQPGHRNLAELQCGRYGKGKAPL